MIVLAFWLGFIFGAFWADGRETEEEQAVREAEKIIVNSSARAT